MHLPYSLVDKGRQFMSSQPGQILNKSPLCLECCGDLSSDMTGNIILYYTLCQNFLKKRPFFLKYKTAAIKQHIVARLLKINGI